MAEVSLFFVLSVTEIWQSCHFCMAVIISIGFEVRGMVLFAGIIS